MNRLKSKVMFGVAIMYLIIVGMKFFELNSQFGEAFHRYVAYMWLDGSIIFLLLAFRFRSRRIRVTKTEVGDVDKCARVDFIGGSGFITQMFDFKPVQPRIRHCGI